jgi:hypothetical protein
MNANKTLHRSCIDIILSRKVVFVPHVYDRVIKWTHEPGLFLCKRNTFYFTLLYFTLHTLLFSIITYSENTKISTLLSFIICILDPRQQHFSGNISFTFTILFTLFCFHLACRYVVCLMVELGTQYIIFVLKVVRIRGREKCTISPRVQY